MNSLFLIALVFGILAQTGCTKQENFERGIYTERNFAEGFFDEENEILVSVNDSVDEIQDAITQQKFSEARVTKGGGEPWTWSEIPLTHVMLVLKYLPMFQVEKQSGAEEILVFPKEYEIHLLAKKNGKERLILTIGICSKSDELCIGGIDCTTTNKKAMKAIEKLTQLAEQRLKATTP